MKQLSLTKTLSVAFAVIFLCALMVTSAVTILRPIQAAQKAPEELKFILQVAGLNQSTEAKANEMAVFQQVEINYLDLNQSKLISLNQDKKYDYKTMLDDPEKTRPIHKKSDIAKLGSRPDVMPIYWIHSSESRTKLVLPIYGNGMWSVIHGYIGLQDDLNTISGVYFYQHEETPGIGDRIQDAEWLAKWQGKKLYDEAGQLAFAFSKKSPPKDSPLASHQIDGITGATKTVKGVENMMLYWFSDDAYRPFLNKKIIK